jgi:hypothetical protein
MQALLACCCNQGARVTTAGVELSCASNRRTPATHQEVGVDDKRPHDVGVWRSAPLQARAAAVALLARHEPGRPEP